MTRRTAKEHRKVYVFESICGDWLVTVSNQGGIAPRFGTREAAEAHASQTAQRLGLDGFVTLK